MKILSTILAFFTCAPSQADEYEDHYDYMQGIVTGLVSDTAQMLPGVNEENIDKYAASANGLETGKAVAPIVGMLAGGSIAGLTLAERTKRLENLAAAAQKEIAAAQQTANTAQQGVNGLQQGVNGLQQDVNSLQTINQQITNRLPLY